MNAEPPAKVDIKRVRRNVLAEKPRVTRFAIKWYVLYNVRRSVTDLRAGIPKTLHPPNILPNNRKPTLVLTKD